MGQSGCMVFFAVALEWSADCVVYGVRLLFTRLAVRCSPIRIVHFGPTYQWYVFDGCGMSKCGITQATVERVRENEISQKTRFG